MVMTEEMQLCQVENDELVSPSARVGLPLIFWADGSDAAVKLANSAGRFGDAA